MTHGTGFTATGRRITRTVRVISAPSGRVISRTVTRRGGGRRAPTTKRTVSAGEVIGGIRLTQAQANTINRAGGIATSRIAPTPTAGRRQVSSGEVIGGRRLSAAEAQRINQAGGIATAITPTRTAELAAPVARAAPTPFERELQAQVAPVTPVRLAPATISAAQPFVRPQITTFEEFQRLEARQEAPLRERFLQPLEAWQRKLEIKAGRVPQIGVHLQIGAGALAAPISFLRAGLRPVKTVKAIAAIIKKPSLFRIAFQKEISERGIAGVGGEIAGFFGISKVVGLGVKQIRIRTAVKAIDVAKTKRFIKPGGRIVEIGRVEQAFKIGRKEFRVTGITRTEIFPAKIRRIIETKTGRIEVFIPTKAKKVVTVGELFIKTAKRLKPKRFAPLAEFRFAAKGRVTPTKGIFRAGLVRVGKLGKITRVEATKIITITERLRKGVTRTGVVEIIIKPRRVLPRISKLITKRVTRPTITRIPIGKKTFIEIKTFPKGEFITVGLKRTIPRPVLKELGRRAQIPLAPLRPILKPPILKVISKRPPISVLPTLAAKGAVRAFVSEVTRPSGIVRGVGTISVGGFISRRGKTRLIKPIVIRKLKPITIPRRVPIVEEVPPVLKPPGRVPILKTLPRQIIEPILITPSLLAPSRRPPIIVIPPMVLPPFIPFPLLPKRIIRRKRKKIKLKKLRRPIRFQPSLVGIVQKRTKIARKFLTGLEVRGIPKVMEAITF